MLGNALLLLDPDAPRAEVGADYPTVAIVVVGALLVVAGLVGVHLRQRAWYGRLGLAAFVLALVAQLASAAYLATANEIPILIGLVTGVIGFLVATIAIVGRRRCRGGPATSRSSASSAC